MTATDDVSLKYHLTARYNKHNTTEDEVHEAAVTKSNGGLTTLHPSHESLHFTSPIVDEMRPPPLADGVEAVWLSFGTLAAYVIDDIPSSHSGGTFPTPTDDTELCDSVSPPADGLLPTPGASSGLDDDADCGIGLNISVVESAANGTLLIAVASSASSPLHSVSPSATKRMQRFFRLSKYHQLALHHQLKLTPVTSCDNHTNATYLCNLQLQIQSKQGITDILTLPLVLPPGHAIGLLAAVSNPCYSL